MFNKPLDKDYIIKKENYVRSMPKTRREKFKKIFMHNFEPDVQSKFLKLLPGGFIRDNYQFGHEYILNSMNVFDLIVINKPSHEVQNIDFINGCVDILGDNGEIWIFCEKTNDILKGDELTQTITSILYSHKIRFFKCVLFSDYCPLDVLIINKNKNSKYMK
jgi:hypothetical protein|uniref:Uncharacterized protein n=1 Tax=viral metagenome TaxID=1070528 RepID=A0A6C0JGA1_9ZZZZ|tara:strand:- start:272 stop:757 length:486 start_codon:yes stop_codon:yes gene_type:complete